MKPLSKLHQETITKAKTEQEKVKAAAIAMIETPMEMIKAILLKHETAVIEVMRELEQAKQDAVKAERERIVNLLMLQHESAKERHNYWLAAAKLVQADVGENT